MLRKNVAGQYIYFCLVNVSTGAALTGATVTAKRSIDGAAQASATGTVTEDAGGQYHIALSQADTNGNNIGYLFTATSAIPVNISVVTTAANPSDAVAFGLSALPAVAAGANGGLPTVDANNAVKVQSGTGANQLSISSGIVGASLSAAERNSMADALFARAIEGTKTFAQYMQWMAAALFGKLSGVSTNAPTFLSPADGTTTRIAATVTADGRNSVTLS